MRPARRLPRKPMRMIRRWKPKTKLTNKIHRYLRWADRDSVFPDASGPNIIYGSNSPQNLSYSFKLADVVNSAEFTSLYDMYRINKVTLYLDRIRNSTGNSFDNPFNYRALVVHDYNDVTPLTTEDEYLEYSNCKMVQMIGNGSHKVVLYPKIANVVENVSGAATAYTAMSSNKVWLNTVNNEVPHFGIKIYVPGGSVAPDYSIFRVRVRFDLSFKNSK